MAINFKAIAERLLSDAPAHLNSWLPGGKIHGREFVCGNLRGDAGKSLSINIDTGVWRDFSANIGGADLISLYAAIHSIKQGDAAKHFASASDTPPDDVYISGPESGPIPLHSKWGKASYIFEYRQADGKVAGYICRFDPPNEDKQFIPRTCWRRHDGSIYWRWKKWPQLSPLYHLAELAARPDAPVLILEGEKKADRAQRLLPDYIVMAWCGGAKAVKGTDWHPLQGRECWMWPDANRAGLDAADDIKKIVPRLKVVDIARIQPHLPENWDLGDAPDDYDAAQYLVESFVTKPQEQAVRIVAPSTLPERLDGINDEYAVIIHGAKVFIMRHWMTETGESDLKFFSRLDFLLLTENNTVYIESDDGKTKEVNVGKLWLKWECRQQYEDAYFEPCGKEYIKRYNLWRGFSFEPKEGDFSLFLTHIHDNICQGNEEYYEWVIAWIADLFQRPARKLGTALVLRGRMGIGKGVFANHIGKLLGKHYMPISQRSQLIGKFNSHMADKLLMFVDEGWWSDDSSYGVGVLRALITEPDVTIEMKGKDAVTLANYTRFIVAANSDWVVPVGGKDERRFSILDVGDTEQGNKSYFTAIQKQMNNGGYEAMLHYFLNLEYDETLPGKIINTPALAENKLYSMDDEFKWWHECLLLRKIGDTRLRDNNDNDIECEKFYDCYLKWCEKMQIRPITAFNLPKNLRPAIVNLNKRRKQQLDLTRPNFYFLQNLSVMREYFEKHIGHTIDWDDED